MAWAYMLRGSRNRFYIGSTTDLNRRLAEHHRGHTHTTKRLGYPIELVSAVELPTLEEARTLERTLKLKKNPQVALYLMNQLALAQR